MNNISQNNSTKERERYLNEAFSSPYRNITYDMPNVNMPRPGKRRG